MSLVLLTNVTQYTGPGALGALVRDGHTVACHDAAFADAAARAAFDAEHATVHALQGQTPDAVHAEVAARWGVPVAVVSNDVHPITRNSIEAIALEDLRATSEALVVFPLRLAQCDRAGTAATAGIGGRSLVGEEARLRRLHRCLEGAASASQGRGRWC